ncbi:uncharacterized protein LOC126705769 [Quercus robur]|uniref:uncharacterized protein LOC126705769 n=1 Tax=Quercus robur TaxID=38942 RepID=UPI002161D693|nr:uncharacterized protein LOC126705769 [Quercus robur]
MHYQAVQERGHSYPTPHEEAVSVASMATESSDKESQGTSFGSTTDSQYNPSDVETDSTSSSGTDDSNNNVAHSVWLSTITTTLIDCFKRDYSEWTDVASKSFKDLKQALTIAPILVVPRFEKVCDLDCSRGCSIVYYRDSVHYSWSSASDSFLTKILSETLVPVDAIKLSISTLQVVVAPILLGAYIQSAFPAVVKIVTPFAPLFAVLASSLLACSVFSENIVLLNSMVGASLTSDLSPLRQAQAILSGELGVVMLAVALLHYVGFFVGLACKILP